MSAQLLDGEKLAAKIKEDLKKEIKELRSKGIAPYLAAVQAGESAASKVYTNSQKKACEEVGIVYELKELSADTTQEKLISFIENLNQDKKVTGIILQMPLPAHINAREVQVKISPAKDVEAIHPSNMGMLVYGKTNFGPPTAMAAMELLKSSGVDLKGKEVVIVGHSEIVGKPLNLLLLSSPLESATTTVCHIATKDLAFHTRRADVILVAVGKPNLIKADMIKQGAVVIDIGINRVAVLDSQGKPVSDDKGRPKNKTVGDVEFDQAKDKCSYISPVPGGVGPLTVTMLIKNTIFCAKNLG